MLLVTGVVGAAACGRPDEGGEGIPLKAHDFRFEPTLLAARAGENITVTIENRGAVEHNFTVPGLEVGLDVDRGERNSTSFTPQQTGSLEFFCRYHRGQGMIGAIAVS